MSRLLSLAILVCLGAVASSVEAAPKKKKAPEPAKTEEAPASSEFDRAAAATAITEASLQKCKATNAVKGDGHVIITFAPNGNATTIQIDKGPWVGTPVAKCMAKEFKKVVKVPAFKGEPVTVGKSFHFE